MQIFVKSLSGHTITLADASDTVASVKERIQDIESIPVEDQQLVYEGRVLDDEKKLDHYRIAQNCTLHLMVELPGGGLYHPDLQRLAAKYNVDVMICRKCYGRLPPRAKRCHKVKCGRTSDIRPRKEFYQKNGRVRKIIEYKIPTSI